MICSSLGTLEFQGGTGTFLTTGGHSVGMVILRKSPLNGAVTVTDSLDVGVIRLESGGFGTNVNYMRIGTLDIASVSWVGFGMVSSGLIEVLGGGANAFRITGTVSLGLTNALIRFTGQGGGMYLTGQTLGTVEFTDTSSASYAQIVGGGVINKITASAGLVNYMGNFTINEVSIAGNGTFYGNNTFGNLTLSAGKSYTFNNGTTNNITGNIYAYGTSSDSIEMKCTSGFATLSKSSGNVCGQFLKLKNIHTTGGAVFKAGNSRDMGNNTGWLFQNCSGCVPPSSPIISGNASVCANSGSNYTTTANTGHTYIWAVIGGSITAGQGTASVSINWGAAGLGSITVTDSIISTSCKTTGSPLTVTINSNPSPSISGFSSFCTNSTGTYSTADNSGSSYVWTISGGSISSGQGTAIVSVTWGLPGLGILWVSDSVIASGCKVTDSLTVIKNSLPIVGFTINNPSQCYSGNFFIFNDTTSTTFSRKWELGNGDVSSNKTPIKTFGNLPSYNVKLVSTNSFGCKDSVTKTVNIYPMPVSGFTLNNTSHCLKGNNFVFTNTSTIISGSLSSNWSFGDGDNSTTMNTVKKYIAAGIYQVKLVSVSNNGCIDSTIHTVTVRTQPGAVITTQKGTGNFCFNDSITLFANTGSLNTYSWLFNGAFVPLANQNKLSTKQAGLYQVIVSNNFSCKDTSAQFNTTEVPLPVVGSITGPQTITTASAPVLYSIAPQANHLYYWTLVGGNIISGQGTSSLMVQWVLTGSNRLKVKLINSNNCSDTNSINVHVTVGINNLLEKNTIEIYPNPFNEKLTIRSSLLHVNSIKIYDLMGKLIFKQDINIKEVTIDLAALSNGMYLLEAEINTGIGLFKILKN